MNAGDYLDVMPNGLEAVVASLSGKARLSGCLEKYLSVLRQQKRRDLGEVPYRLMIKRQTLCRVCNYISGVRPNDVVSHSSGCPVCSGKSKEASQEKYLKVLAEQNREDMDENPYHSSKKRKIRCLTCDRTAEQLPGNVISGNSGCPACSGHSSEASREKYLRILAEQNREDIDQSPYFSHEKRKIRCRVCEGTLEQTPHSIISQNSGCLACTSEAAGKNTSVRMRARFPQSDLAGTVFGKLTTLERDPARRYGHWKCRCECGNETSVIVHDLTRGFTKSCGCTKSHVEKDLLAYVRSLGFPEADSRRDLIGGRYELDIYIESKKFAVEYCGLYWHGQLHNQDKARLKHLDKLNRCSEKGITLITVFADEWLTRNEIVKDRIAALLGKNHVNVGARKCSALELPRDEIRAFEDLYHLQGSCLATTSLALKYQDDTVATASFLRSSDKRKGPSTHGVWELVRYTLKSGTRVQGGLSRLIKHFHRLHPDAQKIISFADRRWSTGKLYQACGFTLEKVIPPDYRYFPNGKDFPRLHKFNFRIHKLAKKYNLPITSEWDMAQKAGFDRIWDCGLEKWVITLPNHSSEVAKSLV